MHGRGPTWAIVVAAGRGARYGGPKQYDVIGGMTVLARSVAQARGACDGVVVVVAAEDAGRPVDGADRVVAGGASRSASVRAGLEALPDDAEVVRNLSIREADKGLSAGEKRMLARARQILVSELTFAIGVSEAEAEEKLDEALP